MSSKVSTRQFLTSKSSNSLTAFSNDRSRSGKQDYSMHGMGPAGVYRAWGLGEGGLP